MNFFILGVLHSNRFCVSIVSGRQIMCSLCVGEVG